MRTSVKTLAAGTLAAATFLIAPAAIAADGQSGTSGTSVKVLGGALTIAPVVTDGFDDVSTLKAAVDRTSTIEVTVDDLRGTDEGWNIIQTASDLKTASGETISASNLTVTGVSAPEKGTGLTDENLVAPLAQGETVNLAGGGGAILTAAEGTGEGEFTANVGLTLNVPAYSKAGTYTGVLTSTNTIDPGTTPEV